LGALAAAAGASFTSGLNLYAVLEFTILTACMWYFLSKLGRGMGDPEGNEKRTRVMRLGKVATVFILIPPTRDACLQAVGRDTQVGAFLSTGIFDHSVLKFYSAFAYVLIFTSLYLWKQGVAELIADEAKEANETTRLVDKDSAV